MINKYKENRFLTIWIVLIIFFVGLCNFGFIRGTMAAFGDVTGQLTPPKTVKYISNYPSELELEEEVVSLNFVSNNFNVSDNTFIITGYEFIGWNTMIDGSGESYEVGSIVPLENHINLYAQWKKVEVKIIAYGDVNINGSVDEDDYLLIENSINNSTSLEGQALINADVNQDGKVDLIDADIIKQVVLGTSSYVGFLPDKPIYIYEIYQGNGTSGEEDKDPSQDGDGSLNDGNDNGGSGDNSSDDENDSPSGDNDNVSGDGNGDVDSGDNKQEGNTNGDGNNGATDVPSKDDGASGGESSGNTDGNGTSNDGSSGNKKPSGGNKKPTNQDKNDGNKDDNKEEVEEPDKNEDKDDVVVEPEEDKENETDTEEDNINKNKFSYLWIVVVLICLLSLRIILFAIKKFKQKNNN